MTITVNGKPREFAVARFETVAELLETLELTGQPVLVELNGTALLKQELDQNEITEGDRVEIVKMVAGG